MHELMQHANFTGLKWARARTWDRVLARFCMPALEKLYDISLKVEAVRLFLIFILNGRRISRSWSEIEDLTEHKKPMSHDICNKKCLNLPSSSASTMNSSAKRSQSETMPSCGSTSPSKATSSPFRKSSVS